MLSFFTYLLVLVLEGEVKSLGWEIPDDIGHVATPESAEPLFFRDTHETIYHTLVTLVSCDLLRDVLYLQQQLDTLDWSHSCLRDSSGNATSGKILKESHGIIESRHD